MRDLGDAEEMRFMSFSTLSVLSGLANTASAPQLLKKSMSACITLPVTPMIKQEQPISRRFLVEVGPFITGIS
eukprot:CAMPEP_0173259646 /NCGR_PEP_ID=MMETSP1142-20121109/25113_1 /TAXON_ID=483371 /ORGANISM="non described non described, Strain CCMP2298" /LENGTH=72 /DNA_ID=CAMNT_0014194253 /DNA_START=368 /DNA_END=583 /DNA_ORIENTATION=+